jgi:hypothetical protein
MSSKQKIQKAAQATDAIQERAGQAIDLLNANFTGRIVNGWGVYSDPSRQHQALKAAIAALKEAEQAMLEAAWPSNRDYPEE